MSPQLKNKITFLYVTAPSASIAKNISKNLLKRKLIACANIIPKMISLYSWKKKIETTQECVVILKTKKCCIEKIQDELEKIHPYQVPCITEIPVGKINPEYQAWIQNQIEF